MSLDNLVRIGQLKAHTPSAAETLRLIARQNRALFTFPPLSMFREQTRNLNVSGISVHNTDTFT